MKCTVFLSNAPKTRIGVSLLSIIFGGSIIGVASPIVVTNVEFFYGFAQAFTAGGGDAAFTTAAGALIAAAAGGGLMIGGGIIGLAGHCARSQVLLVLFLLLTLVGSFVSIVGSGMFLRVPDMVGERVYIDDTNSIKPPLEGVARDMNDFLLAIHNECCVARNWTDQAAVKDCTGDNQVDCPEITDELLTSNIANAKIILCSCAYSTSSLEKFQTAIRTTGFCKKASTARINVVNLSLPKKVPGNLKVQTLTGQRYDKYPYTHVPLVGFNRIPEQNPDQENARSNPYPFGCGFGYAKGIAWLNDVWVKQNAIGAAYGCLAFGLVNIAFLATAIAISILTDKEQSELTTGTAKWSDVRDIPAQFAVTGYNAAPVAPYSDAPIGNGGGSVAASSSAHNSLASALQPVSNGGSKEEYFERLRDFYAIYDKEKNMADVEDVSKWAATHGLDAINDKLMSKYNADLNSIKKQSGGVGAKALQHDLEL